MATGTKQTGAPISLLSQLTPSKSNIVGGCCEQIGKLVSFSLRLTTTGSVKNEAIVTGFPLPKNPTALASTTALVICSDSLGPEYLTLVRGNGNLDVTNAAAAAAIPSGNTFTVTGTYICE